MDALSVRKSSSFIAIAVRSLVLCFVAIVTVSLSPLSQGQGTIQPSLHFGPVPGFTTTAHPVPEVLAIPLGTQVEFSVQPLRPGQTVHWDGARSLQNQNEISVSFDQMGPSLLACTIYPQEVRLECPLWVIPTTPESLRFDFQLRANHPFSLEDGVDNESSLEVFFDWPTIADVHQFEGGWATTLDTPLLLEATGYFGSVPPEVVDIGLSSLLECRVNGEAIGIGTVEISANDFVQSEVTLGPPEYEDTVDLLIYDVEVDSNLEPGEWGDGIPVTFTARTDPPGLEAFVNWFAATKYGQAQPQLGRGPVFTTTFTDTTDWDPEQATWWQWLGVRVERSRFGQDQKPDKMTYLNIVFMQGASPFSPANEVAEADRIYRKEDTRKKILVLQEKGVLDPGGLTDLDEFKSAGNPTTEEQQLLAICRIDADCVINVFFVRSLSCGSLGEAFRDGPFGPNEEGSVVIATGSPFCTIFPSCFPLFPGPPHSLTLAHELGHVLLNDGGHCNDFGNVMNSPFPGDDFDTASCPNQSDTIRMSPYCCDCTASPAPLAATAPPEPQSGAGLARLPASNFDELMYGIEWKEKGAQLARLGARALPVCDRFLDNEAGYLVRRAVILLGDVAAQGVSIDSFIPRLMDLQSMGVGPVMTADILRTLGKTGNREHADFVRSLLDHRDYLVRERSAQALGRIGILLRDGPALTRMANQDGNSAVRRAAQEALNSLR
jgi:hypothetical protein